MGKTVHGGRQCMGETDSARGVTVHGGKQTVHGEDRQCTGDKSARGKIVYVSIP